MCVGRRSSRSRSPWCPRSRATRRRAGLPISGIGGITTWRDAAEFMALGAGTVQVCTAAMTYGFKIVEEMISGLAHWMDEKGYADARRLRRPRRAQRHRLAVPQPQLRHQGARSTRTSASSAAAATSSARTPRTRRSPRRSDGNRHFEVIDDECVGCNLCVNVCPVEDCITMVHMTHGVDPRTGLAVAAIRELDHASEQSGGPREGGGISGAARHMTGEAAMVPLRVRAT